MRTRSRLQPSSFASVLAVSLLATFCLRASAEDAAPAEDAEKYLLRYQFEVGEEVGWDVEHRAKIRTTVNGTTQTAETASDSRKVWKVMAGKDNLYTFAHSVEHVAMRQELTGREEVTYDSRSGNKPPPGFESAHANVGVVLVIVTIDDRGKVVKRENKRPQPDSGQNQMTIELPEQAVAVGEVWDVPCDVTVTLPMSGARTLKTRQRFKLESVSAGIATISMETQILTPVRDPKIEAQLVQRETKGRFKFDIEKGRVVSQIHELDKRVVGAVGEASSMHYVMRFSEKLADQTPKTVQGPQPAGPDPN